MKLQAYLFLLYSLSNSSDKEIHQSRWRKDIDPNLGKFTPVHRKFMPSSTEIEKEEVSFKLIILNFVPMVNVSNAQ